MDLIDAAEKTVGKCEQLGADEAEAFAQHYKIIEIVLERGEIHSERMKDRQGIGIRLIKDRKLGFTYSSRPNKAGVERICREALALAEGSQINSDWVSLPFPEKIPSVTEGTYDDEIANLSSEDILKLVIMGYEAVKREDSRVIIDDGKMTTYAGEVSVANSNGIEVEENGTSISFVLTCMAKVNGAASSFAYEYEVARRLEGFSTERVGELAARKVVSSLNPRSISPFQGELLLNPDVAAEVLFETAASSVNADNVQRGRSMWAEKIGEMVSSPRITIVDDGLFPFGLATSSFDAEGVPSQRTLLIERGILKGFVHDSYTAHKAKTKSTGNAVRADYSDLPTVSITNLLVEPGNKRLEDLIKEVDKGIIASRFSGNVNSQSGDFSGLVKQASYIEDGEIKFPLKETMISGNAFHALNNIVEIGSERRATMTGIYSPPMLVKDMKIVSK